MSLFFEKLYFITGFLELTNMWQVKNVFWTLKDTDKYTTPTQLSEYPTVLVEKNNKTNNSTSIITAKPDFVSVLV